MFLLVTFSSCVMRPDNVLSKRKMADVLYDLHRTDGIIVVKGYQFNHDAEQVALYQYTLDKHGVTQAQFDSSLVWYTDNPKRFNKIYPVVLKRLQADADSYAWLDEKKEKRVLTREEVPPYNLDSLSDVLVNGLHHEFTADALKPLEADTNLYYIFPLETIDSISLSINHHLDSVRMQQSD